MVRFILVTFAFLAWVFYLMSGGADFDPDQARLDHASSDPLKASEPETERATDRSAEEAEVTRVSLDLTSVEDVLNGTEETPAASRLPQQEVRSEPVLAGQTEPDSIEIIPSLVENATPETETAELGAGFLDLASPGAAASDGSAAFGTTADIRVVTGTRVNVRGGPGTSYGVVSQLEQGDEVEVLDDSGTGWVRMRPADGGTVGWMADFLLTDG